MVELVWIAFLALFLGLLMLDLSVLHRDSKTLSVRQALFWTAVWISVAMSFTGIVYGLYEHRWLGFVPGPGVADGTDAVVQYVTGYLLEWSLSVDNIFVIALIFSYLKIPSQYQYRVLFWGIVGAIVLRGMMIAAGTALLHRFDWMFYVFGAILLLSALRMLRNGEDVHDVGNSFPARLVRRVVPVKAELAGARFFVRENGRLIATPLFVALVMVELTDVVFAVDSIPAILAVTRDPFLVFTSNAFAILGLRSLYFAVAGLMAMFRYLRYSLVLILAFVGMKMLLVSHFRVPNLVSLSIILGTLALGILASVIAMRRDDANPPH
ncbi:MAG: TerC family protein [Gammaproteobacteria bacterium]|nr:TerC family protein [Gammaproteobacteria bacterium]MDH5176021.1 TerC family protein [Gammaproteobacteria bacterium]MDH5227595.1 TerC family protein [Gammaproteobacteria bacterium]